MSFRTDRGRGAGQLIESEPYRDESSQQFSVIDQYSSFEGTFRSDRDLRIDGKVKGAIECRGTLFVAQGASVEANVQAENIDVAGELTGEIHCQGLLRLLPSGRLRAQVFTSQLVINDGAIYDGKLEMKVPQPISAATSRQSNAAKPKTQSPPRVEPDPVAEPSTFIRKLGGEELPFAGDENIDVEVVESTSPEAAEK